MRPKQKNSKASAERVVKDIRRATRKQYNSEEKIRIVLEGLRGDDSIAELCRREGIAQGVYYKWSKDFMEAGKKRLAGEGAARKVFRDLSAVFSFAVRRDILSSNPCMKAAVRKTDNQNNRFLTIEEVRKLGAACDALEAEGTNIKALNITRLWALTGCRRQEIVELKWSEIDADRSLLILDDTKTGISVRPLASAALVLLKSIKQNEDSEFVFPADFGDGYFQGTKTIWPKIVKRAGLEGVTPHTLRHTMGAIATSSGEALALTGAILGHSNMRSTMIYAHVQHDPSLQAANRVAQTIANALKGQHD